MNIAHHIQDLLTLWKENKPAAALLLIDRGSDVSPWKGDNNLFQYGDLWFKQDMDILVLTAYGANESFLNFIERKWSAIGQMIAGVTLPNKLPGQKKCPRCSDPNMRTNQTSELFDQNIKTLNKFIDGKKHDGFPIKSTGIAVNDVLCDIGTNAPLSKEYRSFLSKHLSKHKNFVCFMKCLDPRCRHCLSTPYRAQALMQCIETTFHGQLPHPRPFHPCTNASCDHTKLKYDSATDSVQCINVAVSSPTAEFSHYASFSQLYSVSPPCCNPISRGATSNNFCDKHPYFFDSKADQDRHWALMHNGKPTASYLHQRYVCNFQLESGMALFFV